MKDYLALMFGLFLLLVASIGNLFFWQWLAFQDIQVIQTSWLLSEAGHLLNWLCVSAWAMTQIAIAFLAFGFAHIDEQARKGRVRTSIDLPVVDPPDSLASKR